MKQRLVTLALCVLTLTTLACGSMQAAGEAIDETALVTRVEARLAADPEVSAFDVVVSAEDRVVTLTGKVDDRDAAAEAVELAGGTSGVRGVINKLEVPRPQAEIDAEITARVEEMLNGIDGTDVEVRTEDAIVTLSGTVESDELRERVLDETRDVDGVAKVRNALRIGDTGIL